MKSVEQEQSNDNSDLLQLPVPEKQEQSEENSDLLRAPVISKQEHSDGSPLVDLNDPNLPRRSSTTLFEAAEMLLGAISSSPKFFSSLDEEGSHKIQSYIKNL